MSRKHSMILKGTKKFSILRVAIPNWSCKSMHSFRQRTSRCDGKLTWSQWVPRKEIILIWIMARLKYKKRKTARPRNSCFKLSQNTTPTCHISLVVLPKPAWMRSKLEHIGYSNWTSLPKAIYYYLATRSNIILTMCEMSTLKC